MSFSCHGLQRKLDGILVQGQKKTGKCFEFIQQKLSVLYRFPQEGNIIGYISSTAVIIYNQAMT